MSYNRGLHVIRVSDDAVVVKRGITELLISGAGSVPMVEAVVAAVNERAENEVLEQLDPAYRTNAEQLLTALRRRGLLAVEEDQALIVPAADRPAALEVLFDRLSADARSAQRAMAAATVVIRGLNAVSAVAARDLLNLGLGAVAAQPDPLLDTRNAADWQAWVMVGSGDSDRVRVGLDGVAETARLAGALELASSELGLSDVLLDRNAAAVAAGRPFLPVWVEGAVACLGPLVVPRECACLRCAQLQPAAGDGWHFEDRDPTGAVAALAGHAAAVEVMKFVAGHPPGDTVGRTLRLDTASWASTSRRVLKLPRCPVCSELVGHGLPAVLVGPQIPMRWAGLHD